MSISKVTLPQRHWPVAIPAAAAAALAMVGLSVVIASAAKQSRIFPRRQSGLLRCARNDGVCGSGRSDEYRPVARMERSAIRGSSTRVRNPDFAALHPGYERQLRRRELVI